MKVISEDILLEKVIKLGIAIEHVQSLGKRMNPTGTGGNQEDLRLGS